MTNMESACVQSIGSRFLALTPAAGTGDGPRPTAFTQPAVVPGDLSTRTENMRRRPRQDFGGPSLLCLDLSWPAARSVQARPGRDLSRFPDRSRNERRRRTREVVSSQQLVDPLPRNSERVGDLSRAHEVMHAASLR
jgi:hypothetical protein